MTVQQIVEEYLKKNGFDGLCGCECGCEIEDLIPCDKSWCSDCVPGFNSPKLAKENECDFWMTPEKPNE